MTPNVVPLGIGFYTVPEASRLLGIPQATIRRWLGGYSRISKEGEKNVHSALWEPQLPRFDGKIEMGFRDLMELRFVNAFVKAGVGIRAIRTCLETARQAVKDDRPFSTQRFRTDGKTIYLDSLRRLEGSIDEREMLDLRKQQYAFASVVEKFFRDLDIEDDAVARWWPLAGRDTVVIDPARSFGQPIAAKSGVPTSVLADAVAAEGSIKRAAWAFDVPEVEVRDALKFEERLKAA